MWEVGGGGGQLFVLFGGVGLSPARTQKLF